MILQIGLLIAIAPIFIAMMLFKMSRELFDIWLKQLVSTGLLYMMLAVTVGLMMKLIVGQIQHLLFFRICDEEIWSFFDFVYIWGFDFWYPQNASELLRSLSVENILAFILMAMIFMRLIDQIPGMVDLIGGAARHSLSDMYQKAMTRYDNSLVNTVVKTVESVPGRSADWMGGAIGEAISKRIDSNPALRKTLEVAKAVVRAPLFIGNRAMDVVTKSAEIATGQRIKAVEDKAKRAEDERKRKTKKEEGKK